MATIQQIVSMSTPEPYEQPGGKDAEGRSYRWITNFSKDQEEKYRKAIESYQGPEFFAFSDRAYAGDRWMLPDVRNSLALFISNIDSTHGLSNFWDHFHKHC